MNNYELTISPNYVSNWGVREAIRELLQNAIDGETCGYEKTINYDDSSSTLYIYNDGVTLDPESLILGGHSKEDRDDLIGGYHEGMKLAFVVLLRKGFIVKVENGNKVWTPKFKNSEKFNTQVLCIEETDGRDDNQGIGFYITGITKDVYNDLCNYFPCIDDDYGDVVESENGYILLDSRFKGKMYVEGLYIQSDDNFKYGYSFNSEVVDLDRDRKAINYYELRKLTAASVLTADTCRPELFKAISDSCTDVKDITDVLDDASDDFLQQYRDMLYEEKGLEENTLVATESVMRQLEQMDVDMPIVKGTEIESYLVAKANDKLGLIYQAKEAASKKSDEDDAWHYVRNSNWMPLKCWFDKYCKRVSKEGKEQFALIMNRMEPSDLYHIKKYLPEDFIWTEENFDDLEEQIKNRT